MIWQHAVILESIWETDLNITHFPAQRTGLLTPLLTCLTFYFTLLLPFTWTNYSKSNVRQQHSLTIRSMCELLEYKFGMNVTATNFSNFEVSCFMLLALIYILATLRRRYFTFSFLFFLSVESRAFQKCWHWLLSQGTFIPSLGLKRPSSIAGLERLH